jgi:signal transduction histidine kinase
VSAPEPPAWRQRLATAVGLRLAVWYAAVFVVSATLVGVVGYQILAASLVARDHDLLRVKLEEYASRYERQGFAALRSAVAAEQASGGSETVLVRLVAPNAEVLLVSPPPVWRALGINPYDRADGLLDEGLQALAAPERDTTFEVASRGLFDGTLIQVGRTTVERDRFLGQVRRVYGVLVVLMLAVGLAGGVSLTRQALRPLRDLVRTARDIASTGRLEARVTVGPEGDVLGELGRVFNTMLGRIETLVAGMRGALDHVAHDLRTPVARLRARAEAALATDASREDAMAALADCVEEADRVTALLTTLLDISEAQTGTMRLALEPVPVADAVRETMALYEDLAEDRGIRLTADEPAGLVVHADRQRLRQVLANLVDNALKYTGPGGAVHLGTTPRDADGMVEIAVADTGAGIAPADLPRIWDRLYRADESRGEPGLGLGLSLVQAIVAAHGGVVDVTSEVGRGSTFRVRLRAISRSGST